MHTNRGTLPARSMDMESPTSFQGLAIGGVSLWVALAGPCFFSGAFGIQLFLSWDDQFLARRFAHSFANKT